MSEEKPKTEKPAEGEAAKAAGPAPLIMISAAVGGVLVGAVCGLFLIGPRFAPKAAAKTASHGEESAEDGEESGGHGKESGHGEKSGAKGAVFRLDNIIVNPAGSAGSRFLMVTVAVEVPEEKMEEKLRNKEVQVRDAVISILEGHSLQQLTMPGARDTLRAKIAATIIPLAGSAKIKVYLPQFVIQ